MKITQVASLQKKELKRRLSAVYNVREFTSILPEDLEMSWDIQTNPCSELRDKATNLKIRKTVIELQTQDFKAARGWWPSRLRWPTQLSGSPRRTGKAMVCGAPGSKTIGSSY